MEKEETALISHQPEPPSISEEQPDVSQAIAIVIVDIRRSLHEVMGTLTLKITPSPGMDLSAKDTNDGCRIVASFYDEKTVVRDIVDFSQTIAQRLHASKLVIKWNRALV